MYRRHLVIPKNSSFFLFGPRGSGKSTLLQNELPPSKALWLDLLDPDQEAEFQMQPGHLLERWQAAAPRPEWIVIDEVQKAPRLLDVVHQAIERHRIRFALTGSSARKLKRGGANLLAGRAFVFHLHPFSSFELGPDFSLADALQWGTLPKAAALQDPEDRKRFLRAYVQTYLKEEIQVEQAVRKVEPFRRFLEVAAQSNGEILNYSRLGREAGIEAKSVERYFQILSDTLLGFFLEAYHPSIRKRQLSKPKFYFFDLGACRAAQNALDIPVLPRTFAYGRAFEHLVILECIRLNDALERGFGFSYLRTKDDAEVDLIIERPGKSSLLVEVKSSDRVDPASLRNLRDFGKAIRGSERMVLCRERSPREADGVSILPWQDGLRRIFEPQSPPPASGS
ncbi:MAG: ATP-binding protein [Elusimicrobia bacterium]|nr:ATP-binding protein [Elusimicrobiota bacterium]